MPVINADAKALEVLGAAFLSRDSILCCEVEDNVDMHSDNQEKFKLPSRLIAKKMTFRILYGGSGFAFAKDPEFMDISDNPNFWEERIGLFYDKYKGIARWHNSLMEEAMSTGRIVIPTGRAYPFKPERNRQGRFVWPRTKIVNYPVQGFSADLMVLARVRACQQIQQEDADFICTVHDSLVFDAKVGKEQVVADSLFDTWAKLPQYYKEYFGGTFGLPCRVEVKAGPNWHNMKELFPSGNSSH